MSNVLVIGCNGQLGTDCMKVMPEASGVDLPEIDLSDRASCVAVLNELKPNIVVNCAAYTAVDACETDSICWGVNRDGPNYLAEWAAANKAFLVHVSTDYVFPGDKPLYESSVETEPVGPVSEYGRSKLAGEQAVLESGADAAILRTAWLYGATGKNFLKTMLRLTRQNPEKEFTVVNDQFGSPTWSYTLARQIRLVAEKKTTGLFHATSEGYCSWYDLACLFLDEMGISHHFVPCASSEYPTPAKRPTNSILENCAFKSEGFSLFDDWKEELRRFVELNRESLLNETK